MSPLACSDVILAHSRTPLLAAKQTSDRCLFFDLQRQAFPWDAGTPQRWLVVCCGYEVRLIYLRIRYFRVPRVEQRLMLVCDVLADIAMTRSTTVAFVSSERLKPAQNEESNNLLLNLRLPAAPSQFAKTSSKHSLQSNVAASAIQLTASGTRSSLLVLVPCEPHLFLRKIPAMQLTNLSNVRASFCSWPLRCELGSDGRLPH